MQDAGEPDGGGVEKTGAPSEDTTVELRKSCDYCVRLKRACDGKNPCSLCSRRHKPCTRSARKKSGPAKGTKYAPRRKRSVIAEWADRASSLGGKNPGLAPGFRGGGYAVGVGGGGGGGVVGFGGGVHGLGGGVHGLGGGVHGLGGGDGGGRLPHQFQGYPGEAGAPGGGRGPGMPYHGGGRFGRDVPSWREDPLAAALSGHSRARRPPELARRSSSTSSSALPFPMGWYGSAAHDGAEAAGGGGRGARMGEGRGLPSRLDPPPVGYAPTTAEELSRRHQLYPPSHRSAWSVSSLEMEGPGERSAVDPHRRRTWEPHPGEWGSQSNPFLRSPPQGGMGTAHGKRVRLSPPGSSRPLMRPPGAESYPEAELQPRERDLADNPAEPRRDANPDLSLPFLPPPREPPDPMAGFSFHPAANRSTWRRVSHQAPWESPEGGSGRAVGREDPEAQQQQQYVQQSSFYDPSDGPPSSWVGPSGGGGSAEYMGDRGYHGSFRAEAEAGQDRRDMAGWYPQHRGGTDAYRERLEIPPPPHTFDRRRPVERPLVGGGGEGDDGGRGSMMLLGSPPRPPGPAADAAAAAREEVRSRQQMYTRPSGGGGGVGGGGGGGPTAAYGRSVGRLAWPGGGVEQTNIGGRGSLDPRDHRDDDDQQERLLERERGRLVPVPGREDWEGRYGGGEVLPPPRLSPREREVGGTGGAGGGAGAPRRWESERPAAGREEDPWRGGGAGAGEGGGSGFLSSLSASRTERASQQRARGREGEEEGGQDRGLNPPASARSSERQAVGQRERPDMGEGEKEDEKEEERAEHPDEADSRQRHLQQGGGPASPREPSSGEDPVPKNGETQA